MAAPVTGFSFDEELEVDPEDDFDDLSEVGDGLVDEDEEGEEEDPAALAFSFSLSRSLRAFILAIFSASASEGFEEEFDEFEDPDDPEVGLELDEDVDDDNGADDEDLEEDGVAGAGGGLSSCETSWIEKSSNNKKPNVLFTPCQLDTPVSQTYRD